MFGRRLRGLRRIWSRRMCQRGGISCCGGLSRSTGSCLSSVRRLFPPTLSSSLFVSFDVAPLSSNATFFHYSHTEALLSILNAVLYYLPAFFLQRLVSFLEDRPKGSTESLQWGYVYCVGLLVGALAEAIVGGQLWFSAFFFSVLLSFPSILYFLLFSEALTDPRPRVPLALSFSQSPTQSSPPVSASSSTPSSSTRPSSGKTSLAFLSPPLRRRRLRKLAAMGGRTRKRTMRRRTRARRGSRPRARLLTCSPSVRSLSLPCPPSSRWC